MADISRKKSYERNGVEKIVDNDGILWLNESHIDERLDHKNVRGITIKNNSDHMKHKYKLVHKPKNNPI